MSEEEKKEQKDFDIPFYSKPEEKKEEIPAKPKKKKGFRIPAPAWFGIGCAAVLGALLIGFQMRDAVLGKEIALLDSSVPVFGGYSGGGYLAEDFAPENSALKQLEEEKIKREEKGRSTDDLDRLIKSVACSFEKDSGYANKDSIIYACSYDQDAAEAAGIRFSSTAKSYTVSGLEEYTVLDVFAGVQVDWQLGDDGLTIGVNAPQELLDMGVSYTWESADNENVSVHAEFDQNVLRSYGYVVNVDETVYTLGPKPEQVYDLASLSEEEKQSLTDSVRTILEAEIAGCQNRAVLNSFTGSYSVEITGISSASIDPTGFGQIDGTGTVRITYNLDVKVESAYAAQSTFPAYFRGRIYRMPDGSLRFMTNTVHACEFTGFLGMYSLKEVEN